MRIGNLDGEIPDEIKELGVTFVDEMVLLGFKLVRVHLHPPI